MSEFLSIDIETTGLDKDTCQIIEIGAIIDDFQKPHAVPPMFHCYVVNNTYNGEPYALSMHSEIFRRMANKTKGYSYWVLDHAVLEFNNWLDSYSKNGQVWTVTGKNYAGFDDKFLSKHRHWNQGRLSHRVLDPGSMYFNPLTDTAVPNTAECMRRAGIEGRVAHTALEDATIVAELIQYKVKGGANGL
jgi:oligoribonuclease (3'-5' exoribonuclease)